jgi:antirestriction protein ArdC
LRPRGRSRPRAGSGDHHGLRKTDRAGQSLAARITQEIIARLEAGTRPWIKPWRGVAVSRPLRACGTPYRGMNVFWLWMVADMCGYASPFWMTYNQAQKLGGQVRKGAKSTIAIFYKSYTKEVEGRAGEKPKNPGASSRPIPCSTPTRSTAFPNDSILPPRWSWSSLLGGQELDRRPHSGRARHRATRLL